MKIQKGSVQVKMSDYYTATVRDINALKRMLNDDSENKSKLKILSANNVTSEFKIQVENMVKSYKANNL